MKIACIALNSNLINNRSQNSVIDFLNKKLYEIGERISLISYFDNNLDRLKNIYNEKHDVIFCIGTNQSIYNYNIKENLARIFCDKLENNQVVYDALKKYCVSCNIPFSIQEENEVMIPTKAIPLFTIKSLNTGFMYRSGNQYVIFLPDDLEFTIDNYYKYILPLLNDISSIKSEYQVIKCFGILEKDIRQVLSDIFSIENLSINIISDDLDNAIFIRYPKDFDSQNLQSIISNVISKLNKFIYALEDISIYDMACELLKLQKKTICIGETITYGNIAKKLSQILPENIILNEFYINFDNIIKSLNIDNKVIETYGKYSVNSIYEMANTILERNACDIVLFTLGDPNDDNCLMAVGDIDGIHVYKNKVIKQADKTIENLSKTAIFYLIKKLKQNDLHFI